MATVALFSCCRVIKIGLPGANYMAAVTGFSSPDVRRGFACRRDTIVATAALFSSCGVIKFRNLPGTNFVAAIALFCGLDMGRWFARGFASIVT